jgi:hypothetical protein
MAIKRLGELDGSSEHEFRAWIKKTNAGWLPALDQVVELTSPRTVGRAWVAARIHAFADIYQAKGMIGALALLAGKVGRKLYSRVAAS